MGFVFRVVRECFASVSSVSSGLSVLSASSGPIKLVENRYKAIRDGMAHTRCSTSISAKERRSAWAYDVGYHGKVTANQTAQLTCPAGCKITAYEEYIEKNESGICELAVTRNEQGNAWQVVVSVAKMYAHQQA